MKCQDLAERLTDLMEGDLNDEEETVALAHLADCSQCESVLAQTREVSELTTQHGGVELSEADRERMLSAVLGEVSEASE